MIRENVEMFNNASRLTFQRARELRKRMTYAEKKLWDFLRMKPLGYKFRRQHPWGIFIADFYCHALKLVIEVDGPFHWEKKIQRDDKEKEYLMKMTGIRVIRFTNNEIENQFDAVKKIINTILEKDMNDKKF
jgi:cyclase